MDERVQFISDYQRQLFTMTELCDRYGISRKTGYAVVGRYEAEGARGLSLRSSRPGRSPQATAAPIVDAIVTMRKRYPTWGGKKIVAVLHARHPRWALPAISTANDILKRHELVAPRRRRRPIGHPGYRPVVAIAANDVWTTDFKGQFRTRDAQPCYPLTVCDAFSRYLLTCHGMRAPTSAGAFAVFRRAFREYGLPAVIRSDNGEPFAAPSLGRLSRLSVWWIRLGITPELIEPASPYQNGAHERMHRTLKAETTRPPAADLASQQRCFTRFRRIYNDERPHEALAQQPPDRIYAKSPRAMPPQLSPVEYPGHYERRRVSAAGAISWQSRVLTVSTVLTHEDIGLEPIDDGIWDLHFGPVRLGRFDERRHRIEPAGVWRRPR
jgi:transposase InsO family protein